jgi:predicted deacylase
MHESQRPADVAGGRHIHHIDEAHTPAGAISRNWLHLINNGLGEPVRVPILIARGRHDGPTLGLTAAVHGNELNGIAVIQRVISSLDLETLRGTVVGVLAVNVPALLREQRVFPDGKDLNRIAPGRAGGDQAEVYIHRFVERVLGRMDVLVDLHTASFGRVNSFYVRADMEHPVASRLAKLQAPEIIVHNPPNDRTVRGTAASLGIPAITTELRDPHRFQRAAISGGIRGIENVLVDLDMIDGEVLCPLVQTVICEDSFWMYTDEGGLLNVLPAVTDRVRKGQVVAEVRTVFGDVTRTYKSPRDGIVVGRSVNPINQTGSRILHLGVGRSRVQQMPPRGDDLAELIDD